jgi:DNA-binding Lrp family transcriptional regulator
LQITNQVMGDAIVLALGDPYARKILLSATDKSKSVEELSKENDIPISTCYRRVHELLEHGIVLVDRIVITNDGKKYETFRSAFRSISLSFEDGAIVIDATPNEDIADRLHRLWASMRE